MLQIRAAVRSWTAPSKAPDTHDVTVRAGDDLQVHAMLVLLAGANGRSATTKSIGNISQVGADRARVMRCYVSLTLAVDCCCWSAPASLEAAMSANRL